MDDANTTEGGVFQKPRGTIATVYFDGAFECDHGSWAWVAFNAAHEQIGYAYGHLSPRVDMTANVCEYHALLQALTYLKEQTIVTRIVMRSDSRLVINQMTGEFACRSPKLVPLNFEARKLCMSLDVKFEWIAKERNAIADAYTIAAFPIDIQAKINMEGRSYERHQSRR
jgi:ribonuclease HI